MEGTMQQVILIFDGDKYDFWRIKMTIIFKNSRIVDSGRMKTKQSAQTEETLIMLQLRNQWEEASSQDMMALHILQTAVFDKVFSHIAPSVTSKEVWDALKSEFQGTPQV